MSKTTLKGSGNPQTSCEKADPHYWSGASLGVCISHELPAKANAASPRVHLEECDALKAIGTGAEARMPLGRKQRSQMVL